MLVIYYKLQPEICLDTRPAVDVRGDQVCCGGCGMPNLLKVYAFPTTRHISTTKSDIVFFDLRAKTIKIVQLSCPAETNMGGKDVKKR
jgi:hypothetical protein